MQLLERATATVTQTEVEHKKVSPKRLAREVSKEMSQRGISTMAQEAIQPELELHKKEKKVLSKAEREEEKEKKRLSLVRKLKKGIAEKGRLAARSIHTHTY